MWYSGLKPPKLENVGPRLCPQGFRMAAPGGTSNALLVKAVNRGFELCGKLPKVDV